MRIGVITAISSAYLVGIGLIQLLPVWVTDLEEHRGISGSGVGVLASLALLAAAVAAALTAPAASSPFRRPCAMAAAIIAGAALFTAAFTPPGLALTGLLIVAGGGTGVMAVIANACVAATKDPSRAAAVMSMVAIVLVALLTALLPLVPQVDGAAAMTLAGLGLVFAAAGLACRWLPAPTAQPIATARTSSGRHSLIVKILLISMLFSLSDVGAYAYAKDLGMHNGGYSSNGASIVLASSILMSLAVAAALSGFPLRRRSEKVLMAALAINAVGKIGATLVGGQFGWAASQFAWAIGTAGVIVVQLVYAAGRDSTGRLAAAVATGNSVGAALGPGLAGVVMAHADGPGLALMAGLAMAVTLLVGLLLPAVQADTRQAPGRLVATGDA
ncbi:hypothetical protein PV330_09965 [Streptomyces caniscabiei]|uniref:hypothetical protein n=1 Tax=Streptomyces caniscabiei TaxID=2746961 RepID=UPI0029AF4E30|nr:hypothetical protein [Streptomyces caniscabiei]MDX2600353.1 hypothetical protein [Streptomyces caniscabiei]